MHNKRKVMSLPIIKLDIDGKGCNIDLFFVFFFFDWILSANKEDKNYELIKSKSSILNIYYISL